MKRKRISLSLVVSLAGILVLVLLAQPTAYAQQKAIRIGCSLALSGGLASAGKAALISLQQCAADFNAKGGVLGRTVQLVYYDDHSRQADVPAIYTKLITVDKVDFVIGPYATGLVKSALPIIMEHKMIAPSLFALQANKEFNYKYYFQFQPVGPDGIVNVAEGFFEVAAALRPKPQTIAILAEDNEAMVQTQEAGEILSKQKGFRVVYNKRYPPATLDFTPLMRAMKAENPDIVFLATYPGGTVGSLKAAKEVNFVPKLIGGPLIGAQYASVQMDLGPILENVLAIHTWVPEPTLSFPGINEFLKKYQQQAVKEGVDPLGYYLPPFAYACLQMLLQSIEATKSTDQTTVGEYIRNNAHKTVVGEIRFGQNGEWWKSRNLYVQFRNIKGNKVEDFSGPGKLIVVYPKEWVSGPVAYPFPGWK